MPTAAPQFLFGPTPHDEAIAFIKGKSLVNMQVFKALLPELKARAFAITGIAAADVLQEIRDQLAELPRGGDWDTIKRDIADRMHPFLADPEDPTNKRPAEARAELLLRTHGFQAYAVTRYQVMDRQRDVFPYWQYLTMGDSHVRASHAALNGKVLPANHPFWKLHYPPWEWSCRCLVVPLTEDDVKDVRDQDQGKDITDQRVLSDHPALMTLLERDGKVWGKSDAGAIDVRSPLEKEGDKPGIYRFHPESLQMDLAALESRYTPDIWAQFVNWAQGTKISPRVTVLQWLTKKVPDKKVVSKPAAKAPDAKTAPAFPDSVAGLQKIRSLGGSTGAELVQDANGNKFVMKRGANADHLRSEVQADQLYRAMGVAVPEPRIYDEKTGPVKLTPFVEGQSLAEYLKTAKPAEAGAVKTKLQEHFAVDALLGNWDVIGLAADNVLVDAQGTPWRIDNGGALGFRAMGTPKTIDEWHEFPTELWTMRDATKNAKTADVFAGADIYKIAQQVGKITLPADAPDTVKARLAHLQDVGRKALDMQTDQWRAPYSDQLTRHIVGLRQAGIAQRAPAKLEQTAGDVHVKDENGKDWDDLRASGTTYGAGKATPNTLPQDKFWSDIVSAAKTINHHIGTGGFAFNESKVNAAMAHQTQLEQLAKSKGDVKKMAQKYLTHLTMIQDAAAAAKQKIAKPVPKIEQYEKPATKQPVTPAKPQGSLVEQLAAYIKAQGGDFEAVARWKGSQAGDSWNPDAQAYKAYLAQHLDIPDSKIFWKHGKASAESDLHSLTSNMSGSAGIAWTAHHAFVQELLARTELRYNDRDRRVMRLVRTESKVAMKGLKSGATDVEMKVRGLCESASVFRKTNVYGSEGTVQAVPHSRITGTYLMERRPGQGGSSFLGDGENEFTFITPGIKFNYDNSPKFDGGNDAATWGIPLPKTP